RRRSGSHYTPRALTEPIVRTTLEPVLARLRSESAVTPSAPPAVPLSPSAARRVNSAQGPESGLLAALGMTGQAPLPVTPSDPSSVTLRETKGPGPTSLRPRSEQILDLKICDPAMGSGAFLVEACRQLGDALIEAWAVHGGKPPIPPDEDEVVFARRLVAQRCLYGVDKNPTAVDLAKVSLWLAREHPFTFLDHALRHGDSLVGLTQRQIEVFHWQGDAPRFQTGFETLETRAQVARAAELRAQIRHAGEEMSEAELNALWQEAQAELARARLYGDLVVAAFFEEGKPKERERQRMAYAAEVLDGSAHQHLARLEEWRHADPPLVPFHWEIEFPEVFQRANPGLDAVMGNPPFAGKNTLTEGNPPGYLDWLQHLHEESHGNADLVAHFFRRAFNLIRDGGTPGLIATNTIAQGDTRATGLRWICTHGGEIYAARKRVPWPGRAAVIVSVVHVAKGPDTFRDAPPVTLSAPRSR
ncbi:MAG: Eco57I restriction-modification methylase domain-containing protein, partial [Chloroflexaceae bacterium]